jgi:hypothetical protein
MSTKNKEVIKDGIRGYLTKDGAWIPDPDEYTRLKAEMWKRHLEEMKASPGPSVGQGKSARVLDNVIPAPERFATHGYRLKGG